MGRRRRGLSEPAVRILELMLADPAADYYGLDLGRRAQVLTGTVYPLLQRLEQLGWLESSLEALDPAHAGRPLRRLYRFSESGAARATEEINARRAKQSRSRRLGVSPA